MPNADARGARAEQAHSAARDAAERRQRPNKPLGGLARRDLPARHHAEPHRDVRDGRLVRTGRLRRRRDRLAAARHHLDDQTRSTKARAARSATTSGTSISTTSGATGVFAPDGQIDNGWRDPECRQPAATRADHIRQAVSDTIHLTRTLPGLDLPDGSAWPRSRRQPHPLRRHLARQHHQRRVLGRGYRRRQRDAVEPRGPWTSILTDPQAVDFGAPIRAALSAQGLPAGTVGFDNFVRDLQTVIDPVDPDQLRDGRGDETIRCTSSRCSATPPCPMRRTTTSRGSGACRAPARRGRQRCRPRSGGIVRFRAGVHSSLFNPHAESRGDGGDAAPDGDVRRERGQRDPDHRRQRRSVRAGETDA